MKGRANGQCLRKMSRLKGALRILRRSKRVTT